MVGEPIGSRAHWADRLMHVAPAGRKKTKPSREAGAFCICARRRDAALPRCEAAPRACHDMTHARAAQHRTAPHRAQNEW
ncbi:hypothetical protein WS71_06610 [Burkholderia mayonis]|uniref:Uncharacterized protein n=1 Tax=Burkholderia mayonis TaxID=1385591 RepID=A0A1B4FTN5_9BURK|nr:hypothetical protein WS71_06610 [Burkholderia mayonis]KVE45897.1 hypothetical protein WS71_22735 [Burkholderia mayonis]